MREPPKNLDAERTVLGACLISPEALSSCVDRLKPEDFYDSSNSQLWRVLVGMYSADKPVDFGTVSDELKRQGLYDRVGGGVFLEALSEDIAMISSVDYYAEIVCDYSLRRKLLAVSERIAELALSYGKEGVEVISEAEKVFLELTARRNESQPLKLSELVPAALGQVEGAKNGEVQGLLGYSSGFADVDGLITGFQPGSLNIIAARPSMGKTALALNIAQFGGEVEGNPCVLVFSLEMPSCQLLQRMFAAESRVNVSSMQRGTISDFDLVKVQEAAEKLRSREIYIHDSSELSASEFRSICRRFKARHPELSLIVVDYLQLMRSGVKRGETRQNEVAEISRMMKAVALELDVAIVALSQLSRNAENRLDKKPQLWDLRDSGAIEQDADVVIMLYRESYYAEGEGSALADDVAEIRVAKNRNGMTGACKLVFRREYTRFENYAEAV